MKFWEALKALEDGEMIRPSRGANYILWKQDLAYQLLDLNLESKYLYVYLKDALKHFDRDAMESEWDIVELSVSKGKLEKNKVFCLMCLKDLADGEAHKISTKGFLGEHIESIGGAFVCPVCLDTIANKKNKLVSFTIV